MCPIVQLLFIVAFTRICAAAESVWSSDNITYSSNILQFTNAKTWRYNLTIDSNGPIYRVPTGGHFKLNVTLGYTNSSQQAFESTQCLQIGASGPEIAESLKATRMLLFPGTDIVDEVQNADLRSLLHVDTKRFYNSFDSTNLAQTAFKITLIARNSLKKQNISDIYVDWSPSDCLIPMTYGFWNDTNRWDNGIVPSADDDVVIPYAAGAIILTENVTTKSLNMTGGLIINYESLCPPGWSADPIGLIGSKCYKLFNEELTFDDAETVCNANVGQGSDGRHLVHIRSADEMVTVQRMCRGQPGSSVYAKGCWIGLSDPRSDGVFTWISPSAVGLTVSNPILEGDGTTFTTVPVDAESTIGWYEDWRRNEPNNHSLSEGLPSKPDAGGERCAHLVPWQTDPLLLEQGSWNDNSCSVTKPFVCQMFGVSQRYALHIADELFVNGGALEGGLLVSGSGEGVVLNMRIYRSGVLILSANSPTAYIGSVFLDDGSSLELNAATVRLLSNAFIGELLSLTTTTDTAVTSAADVDVPDSVITSSSGTNFQYDPHSRSVVEVELEVELAENIHLPLQPFLRIDANSTVIMEPYCLDDAASYTGALTAYTGWVEGDEACPEMSSNITINARTSAKGSIIIGENTIAVQTQTSTWAEAEVELQAASSELILAGYSARLSTYDAFNLKVAHRGPVVGEYAGDFQQEQLNQHEGVNQGVYRLRVTQTIPAATTTAATEDDDDDDDDDADSATSVSITACIPYNATASELEELIGALPLIQARGMVTVRRYGAGNRPEYLFGYTYRIETDSARTENFDQGPLELEIACYGLEGCGCAETIVPLINIRGMSECPASSAGNYSNVRDDVCVITPALSVERVSGLSHTQVTGAGRIVAERGIHRLPPRSDCVVAVTSGTGVVSADYIDWYGLSISGNGRLVAAGTGWDAWDSSYLLYSAEWTTGRGLVSVLNQAPAFSMFVNVYSLDGFGSMLSACPQSNITWQTGIWGGGIIGGRSTLYVTDSMLAIDENKSLRYGMTLFIMDTAELAWTSGNISLADGADIIVEGNFTIDSATGGTEIFIGMAQLLEVAESDAIGELLLEQANGRNFRSYYGDELPSELRGGWYQNPLCGDQCLATNHLIVQASGIVEITSNSNVTFSLPLDLIDNTRVNIGNNVGKTLASGGICGNDVVIDISSGTILQLSGGQMLMEALCTIQGEGDLVVTAGEHDMAFSIDARITISGGALVWPESRGTEGTIKFNGGLVMENSGELQVRPFSTTVLVNNDVVLKDQCLIQFPLIGIAAQASPFDEPDAPDPSPRGNFTATGTMRFSGGTLRGKADFNVLNELFLLGDAKYIQSLAKLVNKGHCEWGDGDLVTQDNGDFLNLGTVQMTLGDSQFFSNALYKGTELPVESGGDVFALEYHSWDTDNGGLDYTEYVRQRTEFVSRAPEGWTVEDQNVDL